MVELTRFRSCLALVHLSRKPFCSHSLHYSWLDFDKTKKGSPISSPSLCHPVSSHLRLKISRSETEASLFPGDSLETLRRSGRNSGSKFSQCTYRFFIYDGNSFSSLVSAISSNFLHRCRIHRVDPYLLRPSLSHRCDRGSPSGLWDNESLYFFDSQKRVAEKRIISKNSDGLKSEE